MCAIVGNYYLKCKNVTLLEFALVKTEMVSKGIQAVEYAVHINQIYKEHQHLFPKNLKVTGDQGIADRQLLKWINSRKVPKNRQFVDKLLSAIEDDNPMKYIDVSHALSLNDAYWIKNALDSGTWEDYNLYEHAFDEVLAYVAFTGYSRKVTGLKTTPELTSSGMLKKCWSNREDGIYLIKGDDFIKRNDGRSQATLEYYASQVAEAMDLPHIDYDLEEWKHHNNDREIVCKCKLFTDKNVGFVDAATFLADNGFKIDDIDLSTLRTQIDIGNAFGWSEYSDMMLFDSIIANQDRHLGNFGMLVDNDTGKYLKMAPIFDNGFALFYGASENDLKNEYIAEYKKSLHCKYLDLDTQAMWFVEKRHLPTLRKLLGFSFNRHPKFNIQEKTLKLMEQFIKERAAKTIELYNLKNQSSK